MPQTSDPQEFPIEVVLSVLHIRGYSEVNAIRRFYEFIAGRPLLPEEYQKIRIYALFEIQAQHPRVIEEIDPVLHGEDHEYFFWINTIKLAFGEQLRFCAPTRDILPPRGGVSINVREEFL